MNIMAPAQTFSTKNTAPVVQVRGLSRRYGKGPVILDHLDLEIGAGEFIALLGRSGSGKSTLLRTLAGLDAVTEGTVIRPKEVAVVFQESRLLPWKRVWQNILLGMGKNAVHEEDAHKALQEVGLSHRATAWPLTLSGGEAQRAALARALVRNPSFLMLDEPFAALDALTRIRMQQLVTRLWEKHKSAVLLVTHDVDEALMLADRVVVLESGRIHTEISVPLERPRRHANPIFEDLRRTLLSALGVTPD